MKHVWRSILIAASLIFLNGCKNSVEISETEAEKEEIVLTICMPISEWRESIHGLTEIYLSENPEVTDIEWELVDGSMYSDLLRVKLASQNLPDIMCIGYSYSLKEWLPHLIQLDDMETIAHIPEEYRAHGMVEQHCYAIPVQLQGIGILYHEDMLRKAGWDSFPETRTEFRALCQDLEKQDMKPMINHYKESILTLTNQFAVLSAFAKEDPETYIECLKQGTVSEEELYEDWNSLADYFDLTLQYGNKNALTTGTSMARNYFLIEKYAMITEEGVWMTSLLREVNKELEQKLVMGYAPIFEEEEKNRLFTEVISMSVTKNSAHPEEAKKFISWFAENESALDFQMEQLGSLPIMNLNTSELTGLSKPAADVKKMILSDKTIAVSEYHLPMELKTKIARLWAEYLTRQKTRQEIFEDYKTIWEEYGEKK